MLPLIIDLEIKHFIETLFINRFIRQTQYVWCDKRMPDIRLFLQLKCGLWMTGGNLSYPPPCHCLAFLLFSNFEMDCVKFHFIKQSLWLGSQCPQSRSVRFVKSRPVRLLYISCLFRKLKWTGNFTGNIPYRLWSSIRTLCHIWWSRVGYKLLDRDIATNVSHFTESY